MELAQLIGNEALKRQLDRETSRRGLSHAYILTGPAGAGKRTLAGLLAAAMVCGAAEARRPCLECSACRKAVGGIHPDITRIGTDGKEITVAQVRALRSDAYIRPNEAVRKVYIIENAQNLNLSAQNAMLKLLEEGPVYGAFLLLTDNAAALLETVRSRCEVLCLSPVATAEAEDWLTKNYPAKPEEERRQAALRCEGLLGRAAAMMEGRDDSTAVVETAQTLLGYVAEGDELRLLELCVSLEKWDRASWTALLEETVLLIRDALLWGAGALEESDPHRRAAAIKAGEALSPKRLSRLAEKLEELRTASAFNLGAGHLAGWLCAVTFS